MSGSFASASHRWIFGIAVEDAVAVDGAAVLVRCFPSTTDCGWTSARTGSRASGSRTRALAAAWRAVHAATVAGSVDGTV